MLPSPTIRVPDEFVRIDAAGAVSELRPHFPDGASASARRRISRRMAASQRSHCEGIEPLSNRSVSRAVRSGERLPHPTMMVQHPAAEGVYIGKGPDASMPSPTRLMEVWARQDLTSWHEPGKGAPCAFAALLPGTWRIRIDHDGYTTSEVTAVVGEGGLSDLDVRLDSAP
jgi:hypothetical protein